MSRLIEFPTRDGGAVIVEVQEDLAAGAIPASRAGDVINRVEESLDDALDTIKSAATAIIAKIEDLPSRPDEMTVQFGIKLSAKGSAIVAEAAAEANFSVTMKWAGLKRISPSPA